MSGPGDDPKDAGALFAIGSDVGCCDGSGGRLTRVVLNPITRQVTHLVLAPADHSSPSRLVPIDLVDATAPDAKIALSCSRAELAGLEVAEETKFLTGAEAETGYPAGQVYMWPYFPLDVTAGTTGMAAIPGPVTYDKVPVGDVDVRRGEQVQATDGDIGHVQGLVVDPRDHRVTHVLLEEGHLWGRRQVAIPISAIDSVDDGIHLTLSKDQVRQLPEVKATPAPGHR